jgi:uncharacterized protein YbdZ (MbtH family)
MTWLVLSILGLVSSGLIYPNFHSPLPNLELNDQIQQLYIQDRERNHIEEQKQIIIEDYFLFADKLGKIRYARGCAGWYEKAGCATKSFDCAWAMKAYLIAKWIITARESRHYNSNTLYRLGTKKDPRDAKRWDFMFRRGFGEVESWNLSTHFAVVSRDYDGNSLWIYDNVVPGGTDMFHEREIKVSCTKDICYYAGKYIINVATNGAIQLAVDRGIEVVPREDTESPMSKANPDNPKWYHITIQGYPYDSLANEIANRWYDNSSGDTDMIATFLCENWGFNPNSVSYTNDHWLCQLNYNKTNMKWINDPQWTDVDFQKQACLDKRQAVVNKNLWACYAKRGYYKSKIVLLE